MKTIVIGGGASGMGASIAAKDEVILLEKNNKLGKKLLITGNGKCNYFNNNFNVDKYYCSDKETLGKIINLRNKQMVLEFISSLGVVPLIKDGYFYPRTNQAITVVNALEKELELNKVQIKLNEEVLDIEYNSNKKLFNIRTDKNAYTCEKLVLASGGLAYPKTGSTGDGYNFLQKLGHTITDIKPALTGIHVKEKYNWDKVRSKGRVSLYINNKLTDSEDGEIQFTSYGISGICAFNLSPLVNANDNTIIKINFLNEFGFNIKSFISWLDERSINLKGRTIKEIMEGFLNYKLVSEILKRSNIKDKLYSELNKEEKEKLAKNVLEFELIPTGTNSFDNAQSSTGGVPISEINIETMESKIVKNLYITGELLDVTGKCGGYNLGFAFLTGLIAGRSNK